MIAFNLIFRILIFPGFTFIFFFTMFVDWLERKIEARMQNRMGPSFTGPSGILQPLADFIKLITKEDIIPRNAKKTIFKFTPILAFSIIVFGMCFFPIDGKNIIPNSEFSGDLIFDLSLLTVVNFLMFLSGWASASPYGSVGAARVLIQFLGYDIPLFLLALSPAFLAGSLSISEIAGNQNIPFLFLAPWAFILFLIAMQAELEKDPFDIPTAESELVGGLETEYCGGRLAFLHLTRDVQIIFGASIVVELFLGGPYGPVFFGFPAFWFSLWYILKIIAVVVFSEYLTTLFARLRIDQVLKGNWKILLPLSLVSLILTILLNAFVYTWSV